MEVVSGNLDEVQMVDEVPEIMKLLSSNGLDDLVVEYGWGSRVDPDKMWTGIDVKTTDLSNFVQRSINEGMYSPGKADLIIADKGRSAQFRLCHESDIHLESDNQLLLDQIGKHWVAKGYGGFKRATNGAWLPIS